MNDPQPKATHTLGEGYGLTIGIRQHPEGKMAFSICITTDGRYARESVTSDILAIFELIGRDRKSLASQCEPFPPQGSEAAEIISMPGDAAEQAKLLKLLMVTIGIYSRKGVASSVKDALGHIGSQEVMLWAQQQLQSARKTPDGVQSPIAPNQFTPSGGSHAAKEVPSANGSYRQQGGYLS